MQQVVKAVDEQDQQGSKEHLQWLLRTFQLRQNISINLEYTVLRPTYRDLLQ